MTTNEARLAWIAGLIEGEGWFGVRGGRPVVQVVSTDEDVATRLHEWTGLGTLRGPYAPRGSQIKPTYRWVITKRDDASALLVDLLPWLCERRAARAREILDLYAAAGPTRGTAPECSYGHALDEDNLVMRKVGGYWRRRCRKCEARRSQESRARKRESAVT